MATGDLSGALRLLPLGPAAALYVAFVARSPVEYEGRTHFSLFDDAMVSMQYADNLVDGRGLTWSGGERVEGYSNLLWTLVMAGVHLLGLPPSKTSLAVMVIGALLLVLNVLVVHRIARLLAPGDGAVAAVAATLVALAYPLVYWTLRGMEVGLAALLVSVMVLLALEIATDPRAPRRTTWLAVTLVAALLTRDDLLVPCVVVLAWLAWTLPGERRARVLLPLAAAVVAVLTAHGAFRLAYYDSLLPNTYHLKVAGIDLATRVDRGLVALGYSVLRDLWAPLLLAGGFFAVARRAVPRGAVLLAALFLAQCAYSVYVGGDAFEALRLPNRYLSVALPPLLLLAALGVAAALGRERDRRAPFVLAAVSLAIAPLVAWKGFPSVKIGLPEGEGLQAGRLALAAAFAAVLAGAGVALRRSGAREASLRNLATGLLTLLLLLALSGPAVREWWDSNYQAREFDVAWVQIGLALRDSTPPDAEIATFAAGNIVYFSERPGVDLLGKADPVVARGDPAPGQPFRPGHNKMNFEHSLGKLRPTVVVQPPRAPADLCRLAAWGYEQVAPAIYAQAGARGIRADLLTERVAGLPLLPERYPDVPGNCG